MQGRSSIKRDADAVLKALSEFEERPDDPQRGQHTRSMEEVHRSSFKEWAVPRLNDAVKLLLNRNLVELDDSTGSGAFEMNTLTLTVEGRIAFEEMTAAHAAREMNGFARRLLNYLHAYYVKSAGRPFGIYPNEETRAATGLSGELYMQAAHRLIHGGLARWMSNGGHLTITPAGVHLAEQAAQLERVFPLRAC